MPTNYTSTVYVQVLNINNNGDGEIQRPGK